MGFFLFIFTGALEHVVCLGESRLKHTFLSSNVLCLVR